MGGTYELDSDESGTTFIRSHVANYVYRPEEVEDVCLYDILREYSVCKPRDESMEWKGDHPNKVLKMMHCRDKRRIPLVNYKDFPDVALFEDENILTCAIPEYHDAKYLAMEQYAKKACILFVPFRCPTELKVGGSYVKKLRQHYCAGKLLDHHKNYLQNLQDCRNSMKAGRPKDALERCTRCPVREEDGGENTTENEMSQEERDFEAAMDQMFNEETTMDAFEFPTFRDATETFACDSSITRSEGVFKCGTKLLSRISTNFDDVPEVVVESPVPPPASEVPQPKVPASQLQPHVLHELTMRQVTRTVDEDIGKNVPTAIGTLRNIREYADAVFGDDEDQKIAFEGLVAPFVLSLHREARKFECNSLSRRKKMNMNTTKNELEKCLKGDQLICFLNGAGGTGKSHVILSTVKYCKNFCDNLGVKFNRHSICCTALTGAAAVAINGQTVHTATSFYTDPSEQMKEDFKDCLMIIVDEVSFASKESLILLDRKLRELKRQPDLRFGGIHVVFAGDFSQLAPPGGTPLYKHEHFIIWNDWIHTFFELRTNHRFHDDPAWGQLLADFRDEGPSRAQVDLINTRVIGSDEGPREDELPADAAYATTKNLDRMAINDGIFAEHLRHTHSKNPEVEPPRHTICVKGSNLCWRKATRQYEPMKNRVKDFFYATVGEAHVKKAGNGGNKTYDPLLKLYYHRPIMVNDNISVETGLSNGTMAKFVGVELKQGISFDDLERITIDGYYVWCASTTQINGIQLQLLDGLRSDDEIKICTIKPIDIKAQAHVPIPLEGKVTKDTPRRWKRCSFRGFPLNIANARTIHKLQGRSLKNEIVNSWNNNENWIYVALSRVRTLKGLYLRRPLEFAAIKPPCDELKRFMARLRHPDKRPNPPQLYD